MAGCNDFCIIVQQLTSFNGRAGACYKIWQLDMEVDELGRSLACTAGRRDTSTHADIACKRLCPPGSARRLLCSPTIVSVRAAVALAAEKATALRPLPFGVRGTQQLTTDTSGTTWLGLALCHLAAQSGWLQAWGDRQLEYTKHK
jgi:hypothetical protein